MYLKMNFFEDAVETDSVSNSLIYFFHIVIC